MTPESHPPHPPRPHAVAYLAAPVGEVPATEAVVEALARTRPWAMLAAIVFFIAGGLGVILAVFTVVLYVINRGRAEFDAPTNLVLGASGGFFGVLSLVAGVLLVSFIRAAGRTNALRRPEDLERALIAQQRFWRWASLCLLAALGYPFVVLAIAAWLGEFP